MFYILYIFKLELNFQITLLLKYIVGTENSKYDYEDFFVNCHYIEPLV